MELSFKVDGICVGWSFNDNFKCWLFVEVMCCCFGWLDVDIRGIRGRCYYNCWCFVVFKFIICIIIFLDYWCWSMIGNKWSWVCCVICFGFFFLLNMMDICESIMEMFEEVLEGWVRKEMLINLWVVYLFCC